jgi:hypothetical protein
MSSEYSSYSYAYTFSPYEYFKGGECVKESGMKEEHLKEYEMSKVSALENERERLMNRITELTSSLKKSREFSEVEFEKNRLLQKRVSELKKELESSEGALQKLKTSSDEAFRFVSQQLKKNILAEKDSCPICYDVFTDAENICFLRLCGHFFCETCFLKLFELEQKCPLCRSEIC